MSVNPAVAGLPSNVAAIVAGELAALAADAQALAAKLAPGDIVAAVVLPSNGLTDLLDIGGLRVAAELPPTLVPGERIRVEVAGFSGDRIIVQILPAVEPPVADAPAAGAARTRAPAVAAVIVAPEDSPLAAPGAPVAPPVGPRAAQPSTVPFEPYSAAGAARAPRVPRDALGTIEARLATAHATTAPPAPPQRSAAGQSAPDSRAVKPGGSAADPPGARPASIVPRPLIAPRAAGASSASAPPSAAQTAGSVPRGLAAFAEPVALLRALHVPVTPGNVAAARLALETPQRLPAALAMLERALAASNDPRINTLRTLVGFIARIEPASPVLATQIAAFVDHAVVGREGKLVQRLAAGADAAGSDPATAPQETGSGDAMPPATGSGGAPALAAERSVYHQAALDYDLKSQLVAALDSGADSIPAPERAALDAALAGALTAVTGLQLRAVATLAAHPDGLAFTVPIALPSGFAAAHVRIDRDAPQTTGIALDGDNFHIAFVLETQHLGTVAIDLMTVGRTVTLGVKTEAQLARRVFGSALARLTARLETLRYRVAKADASVAPRGIEPPHTDPLVPPARERTPGVDLDA